MPAKNQHPHCPLCGTVGRTIKSDRPCGHCEKKMDAMAAEFKRHGNVWVYTELQNRLLKRLRVA